MMELNGHQASEPPLPERTGGILTCCHGILHLPANLLEPPSDLGWISEIQGPNILVSCRFLPFLHLLLPAIQLLHELIKRREIAWITSIQRWVPAGAERVVNEDPDQIIQE